MYYEESEFNGKTMYRTVPNGVWYEVSNETMTDKLANAQALIRELRVQLIVMDCTF